LALPDTPAAYTDCYDHFERAQQSEKGIRIFVDDFKSASYLRSRLNQARAIERRQSRRVYPPDDPKYNRSENDKFRVTMLPSAEGDGYWVYIELWNQIVGEVEEL
jgi:hypothetical protein